MNDTSTKLLLKRKWTKIGKEEWQVVGEGKGTGEHERTKEPGSKVPIQSLTRLSFWSLERSEEYLPNIYQTLDLFSQYDVNKTKPPNNSETNSQTLNLPGRKPSIQRSQCSRHVKMSEMTYCHTLQWENKQAKCITLPPWGEKKKFPNTAIPRLLGWNYRKMKTQDKSWWGASNTDMMWDEGEALMSHHPSQ